MIISVRFRDIDDIHFKIKAVSATSGGHRATLTVEFDFQRGVFYWCSVVTIGLKVYRFCPRGMGRTDRQTDGRTAASLNAPYTFDSGGGVKHLHFSYLVARYLK